MRNNRMNTQAEVRDFTGTWINTDDFNKENGRWIAHVDGFKVESINGIYLVFRESTIKTKIETETITQPQQSRAQIICDYQNDNHDRDWDIEVTMESNVFGRNVHIKCSSGDIRKTIETLSASFPGEETRVRALGCLRAIFIDGNLVEDFIHFGDRFEDTTDKYHWESFQEFTRKER